MAAVEGDPSQSQQRSSQKGGERAYRGRLGEGLVSTPLRSIHCEGEIGLTAQRSHLSTTPDLVALFPLLTEADRATPAQAAIGARLEVGVDVVHKWRDIGITGKALHH